VGQSEIYGDDKNERMQELCSEINKYNQHNNTNVSLISRMLSS